MTVPTARLTGTYVAAAGAAVLPALAAALGLWSGWWWVPVQVAGAAAAGGATWWRTGRDPSAVRPGPLSLPPRTRTFFYLDPERILERLGQYEGGAVGSLAHTRGDLIERGLVVGLTASTLKAEAKRRDVSTDELVLTLSRTPQVSFNLLHARLTADGELRQLTRTTPVPSGGFAEVRVDAATVQRAQERAGRRWSRRWPLVDRGPDPDPWLDLGLEGREGRERTADDPRPGFTPDAADLHGQVEVLGRLTGKEPSRVTMRVFAVYRTELQIAPAD